MYDKKGDNLVSSENLKVHLLNVCCQYKYLLQAYLLQVTTMTSIIIIIILWNK